MSALFLISFLAAGIILSILVDMLVKYQTCTNHQHNVLFKVEVLAALAITLSAIAAPAPLMLIIPGIHATALAVIVFIRKTRGQPRSSLN